VSIDKKELFDLTDFYTVISDNGSTDVAAGMCAILANAKVAPLVEENTRLSSSLSAADERIAAFQSQIESFRALLERASKTLDALGSMQKDGETVEISYSDWQEAMHMRDEIDEVLRPSDSGDLK
jgi:cob(I)alamin adenosyltransferase